MTEKLRIAVADDEPDMQAYFEKMLPRMGHEVVSVAENGRQLVEHCRELHPDLVITDIKMPNMDGIEAGDEIYKLGTAIPIILVSAYHDQDLIDRAEADHAMAYLKENNNEVTKFYLKDCFFSAASMDTKPDTGAGSHLPDAPCYGSAR